MIVVKGITKGEVKVKNKGEYKDLPWSLCDQGRCVLASLVFLKELTKTNQKELT